MKRDARERRHQHEREALAADPAADDLGHRRRTVDDQLRIDRGDLGTHARQNAIGRQARRHDLRERPVPVVGKLTMGVIDDEGRCTVDVERDVADDADNLELAAERRQCAVRRRRRAASPETPARAKFALTTARAGAPASSRASKTRPASTGISERREEVAADHALLNVESESPADRRPGARTTLDSTFPMRGSSRWPEDARCRRPQSRLGWSRACRASSS